MIKIFYHIYTSKHRKIGMMMVDNQIRRLQRSGLFNRADEINCIIVGPYADDIEELVNLHGKIRILEKSYDDKELEFEGRTLKYLWRMTNPEDKVLYMHTKGVSYITNQNRINGIYVSPRNVRAINGWRHALEYFSIDDWQWQVSGLGTAYHTVGIMLLFWPFYMYAGNFWWASGQHIRNQAEPIVWPGHDYDARKEEDSIDTNPLTISRMRHEQWIFSNKDQSYYHCIFSQLDKPKDDEYHLCNSFWLYEDDLTPHVIKDRQWIKQHLRHNQPAPKV